MSTHMPGFRSFFRVLRHFLFAKLATSSISAQLCMLFKLLHFSISGRSSEELRKFIMHFENASCVFGCFLMRNNNNCFAGLFV